MQRDDKGRVETGLEKQRPGRRERPQRERQRGALDPVKQGGGADPTSESDHHLGISSPPQGWVRTDTVSSFPGQGGQELCPGACDSGPRTQGPAAPAPYESPPEGGKACPQLGRVGGQLSLGLQLLRWQRAGGQLVPKCSWCRTELTLAAQERFQWGDLE